jgi:hypothetical protein
MQRRITLRNVCACGIAAALEVLAEAALQRLGSNHPYCPTLELLKVEEPILPLCITLPARHDAHGLFSERPNAYNPWGKRVLGVSVQLCAACPKQGKRRAGDGEAVREHGSSRCHDRCHGCAHACCSELDVYITQLPEFPLPPADVDWFLYNYFNMHDLAVASIPKDYRYLYDVAAKFRSAAAAPCAGLELAGKEGETAPSAADAPAAADELIQPTVRGKPGAPQLDCNAWLYKTMSAMPDPRAYGHLRPEWQERYLRQVGVEPAGWDKSFREAARHYLHRILRERGEPDGQGEGQGEE